MLPALDEHQLLVFWTQLVVLVLLARTLGYLMRRIGLPSVIGELGAGLLLGPSVFGRVWADGFDWFLPSGDLQGGLLLAVGWVGIAMLLIVTGFETDLTLIATLGRAATVVSASSILVPLAAGLAVGLVLPDEFLGIDSSRGVFALFVGAALSVSSLAVVAKILGELGLMRRDFGQITVAAGMANDLFGWLLLGAVSAFAASGTVSAGTVALRVFAMLLLIGLALTVGQRVVDAMLRRARRDGENISGGVTVAVLVAFGFAVATQWVGVEGVLGAFIAGVVLGRSRFQQEAVLGHIETITTAFLAPVFFATAGLRVDLGLLDDAGTLLWAGVVVAVALGAKFAGSYMGARLARLTRREGVALGAGLNARGALEIVIATVGLSLGVLSDTTYTVIVLVPMISSLFAATVLRHAVGDWRGSAAEQARLDREEALSRNVVVRNERILLPTRGGPNSIAAAQMLHSTWPSESAATLLVIGDGREDGVEVVVNVLDDRSTEQRQVPEADATSAIVAEAKLGYGVIGVGAGDGDVRSDGHLVSSLVHDLLAEASVPVVIVRRARNLERPLPGAFERVLVPVAGSRASRGAQEIAFSLSANLGAQVVLTHVMSRPTPTSRGFFGRLGTETVSRSDPTFAVAQQVLDQAVDLAREHGVRARTDRRAGASTAEEIMRGAREVGADLVVLGADLRQLDDRPYLGHNVEHILEDCPATVVVVAVPTDGA